MKDLIEARSAMAEMRRQHGDALTALFHMVEARRKQIRFCQIDKSSAIPR